MRKRRRAPDFREVGRGTFVQRRRLPASAKGNAQSTSHLALKLPPATGEDELNRIGAVGDPADGALEPLLGLLPHSGACLASRDHGEWLTAFGIKADTPTFHHACGQHALPIALNMVAPPKDMVLTERFSFRMIALSAQNGYRLHGVTAMRGLARGTIARSSDTGPAAVRDPSLQTPTAP